MRCYVMSQYVTDPWGLFPAQEQMLQQARALLRAEEAKNLQSLVASKIEGIRHFDVAGMQRAVAIFYYGRSGSILLGSYLDGHDDVIMLATNRSQKMYRFFEHYQSLSLHDKLICYPVFSTDFFQGDFPIAAADYYAAINALFEVYGNRSLEFLESRRTFFLFLHVVYCVALGRLPASPDPLIVYAQHEQDDRSARHLVEDFPQACFIHTVRDPITTCSRFFDHWLVGENHGIATSWQVIRHLTIADMPHAGMELRTRAIRFEDLHLHLERTMRALVDWLGLPYRSSLLCSTFNGVPFMHKREAISWSGPRAEQAIRDSRNLSFTDRGLLFAVFKENFVAWNYPCPDVFKYAFVRVITWMLVFLIPMKMEVIATSRFINECPSLRSGGFRYVIKGLTRIFGCRVAIMLVLAADLCRRLAFRKKVFELV
jgi:hypothetical protein